MEIKSIGFLVENLSSGQIPYTMIKSTNEYVEKNADINFNLFVEEHFVPCVHPKVGRFGIRDAFLFYGDLVATSFKTAKYLRDFPRSKHFFYIHDLEYLRPNTKLLEWQEIMLDRSVVKFCRSEDHLNELKKQNCNNLHDIIVQDFNIEKLLEIINDRR